MSEISDFMVFWADRILGGSWWLTMTLNDASGSLLWIIAILAGFLAGTMGSKHHAFWIITFLVFVEVSAVTGIWYELDAPFKTEQASLGDSGPASASGRMTFIIFVTVLLSTVSGIAIKGMVFPFLSAITSGLFGWAALGSPEWAVPFLITGFLLGVIMEKWMVIVVSSIWAGMLFAWSALLIKGYSSWSPFHIIFDAGGKGFNQTLYENYDFSSQKVIMFGVAAIFMIVQLIFTLMERR